jgi:hypothetical protein
MRWIDEPDEDDESHGNHVLELHPGDPLGAAFVALWTRMLTDPALKTSDHRSLSFDIADRQTKDDEPGYLRAVFRADPRRQAKGMVKYYVRGDAFDLLQPRGESNDAFNRRQIRRFLEEYQLLKDAAVSGPVRPLFDAFLALRPCEIEASTAYGDFELRIGKPDFGPLPEEDQAMLEGNDPPPANPLKDLMGGVVEDPPRGLSFSIED